MHYWTELAVQTFILSYDARQSEPQMNKKNEL